MKTINPRESNLQSTSTTPISISFASDIGTPVAIFEKLSRTSKYAFLFESTEGDSRLARYSFLGVDPLVTLRFSKGQVIEKNSLTGEVDEKPVENPITYLRDVSQKYALKLSQETKTADFSLAKFLDSHSHFPLVGGFVGYMGYGVSSSIEPINRQTKDVVGVPDAYFCLYDSVVVYDHQFRRATIVSMRGAQHAAELLSRITEPASLKPLQLDLKPLNEEEIFEDVETSITRDEYVRSVEKARDYIKEGQVFQIVLAQRFTLPTQASPIDVYRMLVATNPSPYAYFLKYPEFDYLGSSPETFVQCRNNKLMLRALAGTRPRGSTTAIDDALAQELKNDEKEMAEHRMLVDLGRNDLGRVSKPGTVKWGEIACLTKYTHVMHLATEINGELKDNLSSYDAFQACFPAGTVSGAPKVRAMQLLSELEPESRGIYSGAVGYFDLNGNVDGAIAIRSALMKDKKAHVNAGSGLVYDSKPDTEYQECRNKAKSVLQAIKLAERAAQ